MVTEDRRGRSRHAAACGRVVDRGVPRRPRGLAVRDHATARTVVPAAAGAGLQADLRRRPRAEHRRHGRLHAAAVGAGRGSSTRCSSDGAAADRRRDGPARHAVRRAAVRRPGADRGGAPRVIEFNARFGDPETQPLLALLDSPLGAAAARPRPTGTLADVPAAGLARRRRGDGRARPAGLPRVLVEGRRDHRGRRRRGGRRRRRDPRRHRPAPATTWSPPAAGCSPYGPSGPTSPPPAPRRTPGVAPPIDVRRRPAPHRHRRARPPSALVDDRTTRLDVVGE